MSLTMSLVTALASSLLMIGFSTGLTGLLIGMVVGSSVACLVAVWFLRSNLKFRIDAERLTQLLRFSTPLVVSGVAVWLSMYIDRLMIEHMMSLEYVGLYGVAFRIAGLAALVLVGFQSALTPLIFAHYQDAKTAAELAIVFRIFTFFACLLILELVFFGPLIFKILAGPEFQDGYDLIIMLAPAILLSSMYIFAPGISLANKTHLLVWLNLGGAGLNGALNFAFIPQFGVVGASVASLASVTVVFCGYMIMSQRYYPVPHYWGALTAGVLVTVALAYGFSKFSTLDGWSWVLNCAGLLFFTGFAFTVGLVKGEEIQRGKAMIRSFLRGA